MKKYFCLLMLYLYHAQNYILSTSFHPSLSTFYHSEKKSQIISCHIIGQFNHFTQFYASFSNVNPNSLSTTILPILSHASTWYQQFIINTAKLCVLSKLATHPVKDARPLNVEEWMIAKSNIML